MLFERLPSLTPLWQVSSKDVASIIGPSCTCIVPRSGVTGCSAGRADSPFALSSRPTPPPPPPPEWMDPDVHDVGLHPQLAAAPSAVEAVIEAAAAQAERGGDLNLSSAFVAGSGSAHVRTLALSLGVACYFHSPCTVCRLVVEGPNKWRYHRHQLRWSHRSQGSRVKPTGCRCRRRCRYHAAHCAHC